MPVAVSPVNVAAECAKLPQTVQTWLKAWNSKDVASYLSAYSGNFVPDNAIGRKQWETLRTSRIN